MEENEAVETLPSDQEETSEPVQEETATTEQEQQPEEQEERKFTQKELDEITQKRLARERRKIERELSERLRSQPPREEAEIPHEELVAREARKLAQQLVAEQGRREKAEALIQKGRELVAPDFDQVAGSMPLTQEALDAALLTDNPHEVLYYLGKNREEAEDIAEMPPHLQGAHIVKLSAKLAAKKEVPKASNAPKPINPVGAKGGGTIAPENMDDAQWAEWRRKVRANRR